MKTTSAFKGMGIERRHCLYPNEKELEFFSQYSEANCALECAWKRARMECNCVPWFLKRLFPNDVMCEITGNDCFRGLTEFTINLCQVPNCIAQILFIGLVSARYVDERVDECATSCLNDCEAMEFTSVIEDRGVTAERDDIGRECDLNHTVASKTTGQAFEGQDFFIKYLFFLRLHLSFKN